MSRKLVFGLGNPGDEYIKTRHNIGARFVEEYLKYKEEDINLTSNTKLSSKIAVLDDVIFGVPLDVFMNDSGKPVRKCADFFKIYPQNILIIHDDADLPFGKIKSGKGCGGGHHGAFSVNKSFGKKIKRIRIGVWPGDRPAGVRRISSFVLNNFSDEEELNMNEVFGNFRLALEEFLES